MCSLDEIPHTDPQKTQTAHAAPPPQRGVVLGAPSSVRHEGAGELWAGRQAGVGSPKAVLPIFLPTGQSDKSLNLHWKNGEGQERQGY